MSLHRVVIGMETGNMFPSFFDEFYTRDDQINAGSENFDQIVEILAINDTELFLEIVLECKYVC